MVKITKILPKRFVSMNVLEFNNEFLLEKINKKINENNLNLDELNILKEYTISLKKKEFPIRWGVQQDNFLKKNGDEKLVDYLLYRYRFEKFPYQNKLHDFPLYALIEPTSTCNLRCVMCFQTDKSFTKKPYMGVMDIDFFKQCVDALVQGGTKALTLASRGEPTLHPKLPDMIEYCKDKFLEFKINTNATRLNEKIIRCILENNVDELVYSVDAHTEEMYNQIRPAINGKNNFNLVLSNISNFNQIRDNEYKRSFTKTRVSGVCFREDQNLEDITNFWKQYVDEVAFVRALERWDTYFNEKHPDNNSPCVYLWERIYIWFDGKTNPCDVNYKSFLSPGLIEKDNVSEKKIKEIWTGEIYSRLRSDHVNGNRDHINPCDRCGINNK